MSRRICILCGREIGIGSCLCWLELIDAEEEPIWETGLRRMENVDEENKVEDDREDNTPPASEESV